MSLQNRNSESAAGSTRLLHRLTAALLALVLAVSIALPVFAADEAQTDTVYINSVQDLLAFAENCGYDQWSRGKTVILQEDLSLEDTEWAPVASFSGAFKGNGHTISDVSLMGAYSPAGFFGILEEGGSIQDLTIKGVVNPAGTQKTAGGLVGTNYGTIINCTFSGAVHGEEEAGGLVGRNETSGTIDHSTCHRRHRGLQPRCHHRLHQCGRRQLRVSGVRPRYGGPPGHPAGAGQEGYGR